ncbi:16S rRNA (guanine(527)-N(7))-methyltransferase RsmG [Roseinatronobacter sp. NSM]|uniref:16S rRNA (guanine(527)-N(7))-methyltransferase RsmG n=1 Tax=Roseinatronobacter sp. NSM TaxID=3457785 RepID=UPI0040371176
MTGAVVAGIPVSRETLDRLDGFVRLLTKWNSKINLVAPATIPNLWQRHIEDSAQVFALAPKDARHWVDLGSGGGLPGVVCAILATEHMPECRFTLVESDKRKSAFLMVAARELALQIDVLPIRAEDVPVQNAEIVSARALAPLPQLLAWVDRHLADGGIALLPKGKTWEEELATARVDWMFKLVSHISQTDPAARLLAIKELSRV